MITYTVLLLDDEDNLVDIRVMSESEAERYAATVQSRNPQVIREARLDGGFRLTDPDTGWHCEFEAE